jgi:hypothetical protein
VNKQLKILILFLFFTSCATPKVVNVIGPNDNKLNCEELNAEIIIVNKYADEAQEAKKMTKSHNIAALIFFLPGAAVTYWNSDEAITAAKDRALHLNKLIEKKNC